MRKGGTSILEIIRQLESRGVRLWVEDDSLHYSAPPGAITQHERQALQHDRQTAIEIVLATPQGSAKQCDFGAHQRSRPWRAPLSFTQEAHWNLYRLHERPSIRQIVSAVRLRGPLNVEVLQKSFREVVCRHAALRTQIVVRDGVPEQEISPSSKLAIKMENCSNLRASIRREAVVDRIAAQALEPVQVASDPLLSCLLVREGELEQTLVLSMEHMISDAVSMNILLRDLFVAYDRIVTGAQVIPAQAPIQFHEFAGWLRATQGARHKTHGRYWDSHLVERQYNPFPRDQDLPLESVPSWDISPIRIQRHLRIDLEKWSKQHRTTLVFCVLTAYIALLSQWCNTSSTVIQYLQNGRQSVGLNDTIGYFASPLFLCVETPGTVMFSELLRMVTLEYCEAAENADYSYLESRMPRPAICRACIFNWVPQGPNYDRNARAHSSTSLMYEAVDFGQPMLKRFGRDNDPGITLFDTGEEIVGGLYFPVCRFSRTTMDRFAKVFVALLDDIPRHHDLRIEDISA